MPAALLIVDDDEALRSALAEQFALLEGYTVHEAGTGKEALDLLGRHHYDSIVLDVGLPDADGRDVCRLARRRGIRSPVLILSGHDSDSDTILGLESGANDYVAKPVRFRVLLARIQAHRRHFERSDEATFAIGPYLFTPSTKMLIGADTDQRVVLTLKEAEILAYLYRAGDRAVSRQVLLDEVWGYSSGVTTHTLETHIYRLRQKIGPGAHAVLVTETGGYRLAR